MVVIEEQGSYGLGSPVIETIIVPPQKKHDGYKKVLWAAAIAAGLLGLFLIVWKHVVGVIQWNSGVIQIGGARPLTSSPNFVARIGRGVPAPIESVPHNESDRASIPFIHIGSNQAGASKSAFGRVFRKNGNHSGFAPAVTAAGTPAVVDSAVATKGACEIYATNLAQVAKDKVMGNVPAFTQEQMQAQMDACSKLAIQVDKK
jgi:hypothetical protein